MRIFVSYARRDRAAVEGLLQDIRRARHEVWVDEELTGGQSWWDTILGTIRGADLFVVALSPDWLTSMSYMNTYRERVDEMPHLPATVAAAARRSTDNDRGSRCRARIDAQHQQAESFGTRREVVGDARRNLAFRRADGQRHDCLAGSDRLGALEQLIVGGQVPLVSGSRVALDEAATTCPRDRLDHGVEARDPLGSGVDHRPADEFVRRDRQHHMGADPAVDGLFEHDDISARRCGRDQARRSQRVEHLGDACPNCGFLTRRKSRYLSAGEVDSIARVNQQHIGRVLPTLGPGAPA